MIRFLFLLIVFAAGLAAAAVYFGRIHHVRMAMPEGLPAWTEALPDDAGLRSGRMPMPAEGIWPPIEISWQAQAPDLSGLRWRIRATGEGIDIAGDLTMSYWPDTARLSAVTGTVALDQVSSGQVDLEGLLALRDGSADARGLLRTPVVSGRLMAELLAVKAGGAAFGQGPASAVLQEDQGWRLDLQLEGGVSPVSGSLTGQIPQRSADLDVVVSRGQDLPTAFRDVLSSVGQPEGQGWRVAVPVPVY
ncbi:MAG: type II secretion system protein N [Rhodobacter sp.]|nr:type II secretion system protein N [Rhodobacter sp.]